MQPRGPIRELFEQSLLLPVQERHLFLQTYDESLQFSPPINSPSVVVDADLLRQLTVIYNGLLIQPGFPDDKCFEATQELVKLGLAPFHGWFTLDRVIEGFSSRIGYRLEPHSAAIDKNQTIIDLTATQFRYGVDEVIPRGVLLIKPAHSLYPRYKQPGSIPDFQIYRAV